MKKLIIASLLLFGGTLVSFYFGARNEIGEFSGALKSLILLMAIVVPLISMVSGLLFSSFMDKSEPFKDRFAKATCVSIVVIYTLIFLLVFFRAVS
ncbi:MAG: hypothetical protein V4658_11600 [Bacteroidota bacterium]